MHFLFVEMPINYRYKIATKSFIQLKCTRKIETELEIFIIDLSQYLKIILNIA